MEMTFSETADMIEESAEEVIEAPDFEKKALRAEELLTWSEGMGMHTARFARLAWLIDMLFFFLALLALYGVLFARIGNLFPSGIGRFLRTVRNADGFTREVRRWLFCVLGLTALPLVSDIILSILCKNSAVRVRRAIAEVGGGSYNPLQRIKIAVYNAQEELNPTSYLPPWTVYGIGAVYLIPMLVKICALGAAREHSTLIKFILVILGCTVLFLLAFGIFMGVLWLKLFVLSLCFSSGSSKRALEELIEELPEYEAVYGKIEAARLAAEAEQKRLADLKEGAELYKKAKAEGTVNKVLLARAAEKGDPRANLEIGKTIVENVDGLNRREAAALYADAKRHFQIADAADLPDGILMYASARLMTEAHDTMGWLNILRRLRSVERINVSVKLRTFYTKVRDQLIERVQIAMAHAENDE